MVTDTLLRVAVHCPRQDRSADLVLPAGYPVAALLPALVEAVLGAGRQGAEGVRWFVAATLGSPLDPAKSLRDNGVGDGDLLLLTDEPAPVPRVRSGAPSTAVVAARRGSAVSPLGGDAVVTVSALLALAGVLGWVGWTAGQQSALWVSAAIAVAAAAAAAAGRFSPGLSDALGVGAVGNSAVTGALAASGFAWPVVVAFAAASASAMAVCLTMSLHSRAIGPPPAVTACAAAGGAVMFAAVTTAASGAVMGPVLTGVSLAALTASAPLTVALTGIGPSRHAVGPRRALAAQQLLTGLTVGFSATTAAGVALVALHRSESRLLAGLFAAVVSAVLVLRSRVHADPIRRVALTGAGLAASGVALVDVATAHPDTAPWWCGAAAAAGAALMCGRSRGRSHNPLARSVIRGAEYVALATVVPVGAWLAGAFEALGAVSL